MKDLYLLGRILWVIVFSLSLQTVVNAQVDLTLTPYNQNFNSLSTTNLSWSNGGTLPGWYAMNETTQGNTSTAPTAPQSFIIRTSGTNQAKDKLKQMVLVNFAQDANLLTDRSLGYITHGQSNPIAYYGIRFKNNSGIVIRELTVELDIKTIHNGSKTNGLLMAYKVGATPTETLTSPIGTGWTAASQDTIRNSAPTNGKSITFPVNVPVGHEIFIRFVDPHISGNSGIDDDLAIDNFKVTISKTFYNRLSGVFGELNYWNTNPKEISETETGVYCTSFTDDRQTFIVQHNTTLSTPMTISGVNSKLIVQKGKTLTLDADLTATVDVEAEATVIVNSAHAPTFGNLDPASTIIYTSAAPILATTYGNLVIDGKTNGLSKVLEKSIVVKGNLSLLNNSKLDIKAFDLTVEGVISNSDDLSFIQASGTGKVKKALVAGQAAYTIPLGTSSISPIIVKLVSGTSDVFSVGAIDLVSSKYTGYSPNGIPVDKGAVSRTWFVSEGTVVQGETNNLEVTLQWTSGAQQTDFTPEKLSMGFYQNNSTWDNGSIMSATQSGELHSATRSVSASSISPFVIFTNGAVTPNTLPVELTSFTGSRAGNVAKLSWATASEKDNDYFQVERSQDGKSFASIGKVDGNGTSNVVQEYTFTDAAAPASTVYYRLKQVDFDGKFEYSKVIALKAAVKASSQASLAAYPNPTPGKVYVTSLEESGQATVTLFHSSGKAVSRQQVQVEVGQPISMDLTGQPSGVYYLQMQTSTGKSTTRLVKQ